MPKTKNTEKRYLSSEERNQLRDKAYWLDPRKLRIASPDPKIYPRSLWRKIQEFQPQPQNQNQKDHE